MPSDDNVIQVDELTVQYSSGKSAVPAVDGMTFSVRRGECVGFIGANGAGKSTTMKCLMGFLFPAAGALTVFDRPAGDAESRRRIGYLPEVALYYPFMKARELLELYGGLQGVPARELKRRIPALLDKVGLPGRGEQLLRHFSKGMQQRLGIAQALIAEPDLFILDELSSGLDPLGRFDLREVILELKASGRTVFFSSHELTEVESLCDRVLIVHRGRIVRNAPVPELMNPLNQYVIAFSPNGSGIPDEVQALQPDQRGDRYELTLSDLDLYTRTLSHLAARRCVIHHTASRSRSLEDYFINLVSEQAASA